MDSCDPGIGCVFERIPGCDSRAPVPTTPSILPSQSPLPAAPDIDALTPTATPQPNFFGGIVEPFRLPPPDTSGSDDGGPPPGESENEVVAQSEFGYGGAIVGVTLVSCAGCCAMIFGVLAAKDIDKEEDRLEMVLDVDEELLSSPVENQAFAAAVSAQI